MNKISKDESIDLPEHDFWDDLPDVVKEDINEAIGQLDRGEGIPHAEVMAKIKEKCLKKTRI